MPETIPTSGLPAELMSWAAIPVNSHVLHVALNPITGIFGRTYACGVKIGRPLMQVQISGPGTLD
jgi:hypothetical protein